MVIKIIGACVVLTFGIQAWAYNMGLTINQTQEKVQNSKGSEDTDPISFGLAMGHEFSLGSWITKFSPRLGYVKNTINSDDHYSGKYKMETLYILYDFVSPMNSSGSWSLRYGFGNFIKKIKGDGGTVTIPNGAGTATAYKPGKAQQSYSSTLDLGVDWLFYQSASDSWIQQYSSTLELFCYELLDAKKRTLALQISLTGHF